MKLRKRMGRRPVPKEKRRSIVLTLRVTERERELLEILAVKTETTVGDVLMRPWRTGRGRKG